jgi:lycopene beta-cyclase
MIYRVLGFLAGDEIEVATMTYFGFLGVFLVIPILVLLALNFWDERTGRKLPAALRGYPGWMVILAHVIIAVVYTTPWDNYLVATRVWWYEPELVVGITLGWVPIEEYTFFVLQPIFTGLWLLFWARRLSLRQTTVENAGKIRFGLTAVISLIWFVSLMLLISGWQPGTYLNLLLVWALPPVMLQTAFGGDILWRNWRLVLIALIPTSVYLSVADAIAIDGGTWTINPDQSLNIFLGGVLPIEEAIFFFMTNVLISVGMTLVLSVESQARVPKLLQGWLRRGDQTRSETAYAEN